MRRWRDVVRDTIAAIPQDECDPSDTELYCINTRTQRKRKRGAAMQQENQRTQWQQETAEAIAKRLLVAAQACVLVWALARATAPAAEPTRALLIRLSGRLMKRHQPYTAPALLAGLWVLLAMVSVLDDYSVADLRRVAAHALPVWQSPTEG